MKHFWAGFEKKANVTQTLWKPMATSAEKLKPVVSKMPHPTGAASTVAPLAARARV